MEGFGVWEFGVLGIWASGNDFRLGITVEGLGFRVVGFGEQRLGCNGFGV